MPPLRIATRGSKLALWQANHVAELLRPILAPRGIELVTIQTTGDRVKDESLSVIGGQGAFTREIQQAVLEGRADLAVHSLKDLPTAEMPGLRLAAVPPRGPTADALISTRHASLAALPQGAKVGTGSQRRGAQLLHVRPDLQLVDLRGNVDTRLRKLREQNLDAIILARAGLERLGLEKEITELLEPPLMFPAVGQGALGLECRADDTAVLTAVRQLNDPATEHAVLAERAFLRQLGGGCLLPIAALANVVADQLHLQGVVLSADGRQRLFAERRGLATACETIGREVADELLNRGAAELLASHPLPGSESTRTT